MTVPSWMMRIGTAITLASMIAAKGWAAWAQTAPASQLGQPVPTPTMATSPRPGSLAPSPDQSSQGSPAPGVRVPATGPPPAPMPALPATSSNNVHVKADVIEYDRPKRVAIARGNVDVTYQGFHITTEQLQLDQNTNVVTTDRPFVLIQDDPIKGKQTIKGTSLQYGLKTQDATISDSFLQVPAPSGGQSVFVSGLSLKSQGRNKYEIESGTFTSCDEVNSERVPHYHVTSQHLELVPDDYALGWNSWIYVNNQRFLWLPAFWVPLKKRETSFAFGQNDVEGYFIKTTLGYHLSDQHSGTLYLNYMQKKGPGVGVSHTWSVLPLQLSLFEAYGLPESDPAPTGSLYVHGLSASARHPFDDYLWHIRHQQRLFDTMTVDVSAEDYNIYTVQTAQGVFGNTIKVNPTQGSVDDAVKRADYRDDHTSNKIRIDDQRGGVTYDFTRQYKEDRNDWGTAGIPASPQGSQPTTTHYESHANWSRDASAIQFATNYDVSHPYYYPTPPPSTDSTAIALPSPSPSPADQDTRTLDANLNINQRFGGVNTSWVNHYTRSSTPAQVPGGPRVESEKLNEKLDLTDDLGWGDARMSVDKQFLFQPGRYLFDPTKASSPSVLVALGYKETLPEVELRSKPLLPEWQPFTLAADAGRYFEWAQLPTADQVQRDPSLAPFLGTISRFHPHLDLTNKPHDLGWQSTLDFGGSSAEQRFYSTGDAAYASTLNSVMATQYTSWLHQNLTYHKVLPGGEVDPKKRTTHRSTTPFRWDAMALAKATTLNGEERLDFDTGAGGKVSWSHTLGYDYERLRYNDYTTNLSVNPEPRITGSLGTGYHFPEVPYLELNRATLPDGRTSIGHWAAVNSSVTVRSTADAFGGNWGQDRLVPGSQVTGQLNWDPDKGKITNLKAEVVADFGTRWQDHWEIYAGGEYVLDPIPKSTANPKGDPDHRTPRLISAGISRDLHDFILSLDYSRQAGTIPGQDNQTYTLRLRMIAFGQDLINLSNNGSTTNLTGGIGGQLLGSGQ